MDPVLIFPEDGGLIRLGPVTPQNQTVLRLTNKGRSTNVTLNKYELAAIVTALNANLNEPHKGDRTDAQPTTN